MNKKLIITLSAAFLGIVAIGIGSVMLIEYLSWKTIQFNLSAGTSSIKIYDAVSIDELNNQYIDETGGDEEAEVSNLLATINGSGTARLKEGRYYVVPSGDTIANDIIAVDIKNDTSAVSIAPYSSSDYLFETHSQEIPAIQSVIKNEFPSVAKGYSIAQGVFYHTGEWYSTTLHDSSPYAMLHGYDTYGVILHKEDGAWKVAARPSIVFSYSDNRSIPEDIVDAVNRYTSGL